MNRTLATPVSDAVNRELFWLAGPHSRLRELWLVLRVVYDFIKGFRTLHFVGPCVTVFGSARYGESHPEYATGREVGSGVRSVYTVEVA